ncbi:cytochrome-c peroxidase [Phycisphaera mikurensis]|uniref:Methylamine utilization protein MauG n=1 Tax=Phycisphaera mikurensis (strain NBRC 102666 / KCTC 22515 / FYK2301M01) TaxID=1142394 RepID=I0IE10_PHYMF|nr:cytochrome c peroxidase [Phycisphaera mikurensis]MBB6441305.1 cytochrome c peroxidase [Phycisphaera mikurensis]BAM03498.1 cytochrome c peroxidase [Phycisphaera mikurensis NBRC 102666]
MADRRAVALPAVAAGLVAGLGLLAGATAPADDPSAADLRAIYSQPPAAWPAATVDEGVEPRELGLLPELPEADEKLVGLGEMLFFDPRLSTTGQMACASCHDPDLGWADGRTTSFGFRRTQLPRNAPTIQNSGHLHPLFWDGRAGSLEELTLEVIEHPDEMRGTGTAVVERLSAVPAYAEAFAEIPGEPGVTIEKVTSAVAAFCRSVNGGKSRFDAFLRGRETALTDAELRGLHLYRTEARCMNCHDGPEMSDGKLHVTGLSLSGTPREDLGAYAVTGRPEDSGAFRTPTLRNIAKTGPYMHHGLFESLPVTLRAYNGGMPTQRDRINDPADPVPVKSPLLHELGLDDAQLGDLEAFLRSTTEPHRLVLPPDLPPHADDAPPPAIPPDAEAGHARP